GGGRPGVRHPRRRPGTGSAGRARSARRGCRTPGRHDLRIRFRIDGVLHEVMHSPRSIQGGVISRLKVMADINIAERRIPQDGRISMKANGRGIDLRVATLPTVYGEKVVMRILDKGQAVLSLDELGFLPETRAR